MALELGVSCVVLLGALWLVPLASVHGQTTVNYNFEDGVMRGDPTQMQVPPKILSENGNEFMRITGSTGDCENLPSDLCPPRNRSTVRFTSSFSSMPLISDANMRQTYSAKIRFHDDTGTDGIVFELYQSAPTGSLRMAPKTAEALSSSAGGRTAASSVAPIMPTKRNGIRLISARSRRARGIRTR